MRTALLFLFLFLANFSFSQQDTIGDPSSGYPYWIKSTILKNYVLAPEFASSSDTQQIVFRAIFGSPLFLDSFQIFVWENDEQVQFFPGKVLQADQTVYLYNGSEYLGQDKVQIGEGVWSPISRIMANYTPEPVALEMPGTVKQEQPQVSLVKEEAEPTNWFKDIGLLILISLGVVLAFLLLLFLLSKIANLVLDGISWLICFFQERRQKKQEVENAAIIENLEKGVQVDEAGEPQVPGGLGYNPVIVKNRLEQVAGERVEKFWPVVVEFLQPVEIGYRNTTVSFKPNKEDFTIYYLGQTFDSKIVLCAMRCGNSIMGSGNEPLQLGKDFFIKDVIQTPEVENFLWAVLKKESLERRYERNQF